MLSWPAVVVLKIVTLTLDAVTVFYDAKPFDGKRRSSETLPTSSMKRYHRHYQKRGSRDSSRSTVSISPTLNSIGEEDDSEYLEDETDANFTRRSSGIDSWRVRTTNPTTRHTS